MILAREAGTEAAARRQDPVIGACLFAAAGGVVLSPGNRQALRRANARVVWLCASNATLLGRVRSGAHRPLLDADPEAALLRMAAERDELYREVADACVSTEMRSPGEVLEAVLR